MNFSASKKKKHVAPVRINDESKDAQNFHHASPPLFEARSGAFLGLKNLRRARGPCCGASSNSLSRSSLFDRSRSPFASFSARDDNLMAITFDPHVVMVLRKDPPTFSAHQSDPFPQMSPFVEHLMYTVRLYVEHRE